MKIEHGSGIFFQRTCLVKAALYVATRKPLAFTLSIVDMSLSGMIICMPHSLWTLLCNAQVDRHSSATEEIIRPFQ